MKKSLLVLLAVVLVATGSVFGQASLSFSGGNGSPLSITLAQPIVFTITAASPGSGPIFVFQSVGNPFGGASFAVTGSLTFSINNAGNQAITAAGSGITQGNINPTDLFMNGSIGILSTGKTIRLNAGTLTTSANVTAAPPVNGSYAAFITNTNGTQISTFGAPVPEPNSILLAVTGGLGLLLAVNRRRRAR